MHDLSAKFQVSECNIAIFMHVPRYALDVPTTLSTHLQLPGKILYHSGTLFSSLGICLILKVIACLSSTNNPGTQASNNFSNQADPKGREECARVIENFARRLQMCRQCGGRHLEHILEHA